MINSGVYQLTNSQSYQGKFREGTELTRDSELLRSIINESRKPQGRDCEGYIFMKVMSKAKHYLLNFIKNSKAFKIPQHTPIYVTRTCIS